MIDDGFPPHSAETVLHHFVEDYQGGGEGVIGTAGKTKEQVTEIRLGAKIEMTITHKY